MSQKELIHKMAPKDEIKFYSPREEKINVLSHGLGLIFSLLALPLLVVRAARTGSAGYIVSFAIFGISLIVLYAASFFYHRTQIPAKRKRLRIFDHASIYALIAGTYTPFTLLVLQGSLGWTIFAISWGMALAGIVLKLFFTGKYGIISTLMYVFMGWLIVFAIKPLIDNLSSEGLRWLFAGGLAYTLGAVIYGIKKLHYNHTVFHLFVLLGSFCHFIAVYFYI